MILGLTRRDILAPILWRPHGFVKGREWKEWRIPKEGLQGSLDAHVSPMYKGIQDSLGFWTQLFEDRLALTRG